MVHLKLGLFNKIKLLFCIRGSWLCSTTTIQAAVSEMCRDSFICSMGWPLCTAGL